MRDSSLIVQKRFGRLKVLRFDKVKNETSYYYWCRCDCGKLTSVQRTSLVSGATKSCGCLQRELRQDSRLLPEDRFWPKVEKTDTCWIWTAADDGHGYGVFNDGRRVVKAYRFSYELKNGPISKGMQIDHLCKNRKCVNPDHLEVVTQHENLMRGDGPAAINARKTRCNNDHEYTPENTVISRSTGKRRCRICTKKGNAIRMKAWLEKKKLLSQSI